MRIALFLTIFFLALIVSSAEVSACMCTATSPENLYKQAATIFEGEVVKNMAGTQCSNKVMLRVDKVYKGVAEKEINITVGGCSSCDRTLEVNKKYVIFAQDNNTGGLGLNSCDGSYSLAQADDNGDKRKFLEEKLHQMQSINAAIDAQPDRRIELMKIKAEHSLHWRDNQQAEIILKDIIKQNKGDDWASNELMGLWLRVGKPQEIWDFKEKPKGRQTTLAVSYAALVLGRQVDEAFVDKSFQLWLESLTLENIQQPKLKFHGSRFQSVSINNSNFKDAEFPSIHIADSRLSKVSFSGARFEGAYIENSSLIALDFTGANLTNSKIYRSQIYESNFKDAAMSGVKLEGTLFSCGTIWPEGFDPVAAGGHSFEACK